MLLCTHGGPAALAAEFLIGAPERAVVVTGYTGLHLLAEPETGGLQAGRWRAAVLGDVGHLRCAPAAPPNLRFHVDRQCQLCCP